MSHQLSSEEQFAEIKEFLAKTWKIIVAVIIIGLLAFWGWRYWQSYQSQKMIDASDKYEQLIAKLDDTKADSVNELVAFAKENNTVYGVFANLRAAQFYVEVLKDYSGAQELLVDGLKKNKAEPIKAVINIRIARLQYQQGQYEQSLNSLNNVTEESWAPVVNDIRGDVLAKMTRYADAVDAYKVALNSQPTKELEVNIKMKLNQTEYLSEQQQIEQKAQADKEKAEQEAQAKEAESEQSKN
ncbi:hypothetical protein A9G13_08700 [Gilliamella sp. wkB178]|uniref:YfgM family protein n=1 Tax=Gilliamella sp. wkB178 TaxID=3120259 RepID=UPI00080DDCBE|nr:tetratricopeptide repeat protein [Gilliamella apicola]OCG07053.1 hypothetical protein A9G13_08700 [Gilliamella apicola]